MGVCEEDEAVAAFGEGFGDFGEGAFDVGEGEGCEVAEAGRVAGFEGGGEGVDLAG